MGENSVYAQARTSSSSSSSSLTNMIKPRSMPSQGRSTLCGTISETCRSDSSTASAAIEDVAAAVCIQRWWRIYFSLYSMRIELLPAWLVLSEDLASKSHVWKLNQAKGKLIRANHMKAASDVLGNYFGDFI